MKKRWLSIVDTAEKDIPAKTDDDKVKRQATVVSYFEKQWKLLEAQGRLEQLAKAAAGTTEAHTIPSPDALTVSYVPHSVLTDSRIKEFCAICAQELFVSSSSKHPAEKFGCTSCHQGQGAGTTFNGSFHSPNNSHEQEKWKKDHAYGSDTHTFLWDYPMLPMRFVESSCLKCHHQVTDLYSPNNRNEAPKLLKGYKLIRENGCFGCHEIQGRKEGRPVGPDLRLEPMPPLDDLTHGEQEKIKHDVDNLPGNYRKVGPSLYRLAEKTNKDWTLKWLRGPREFRPDTKMPHFYDLANNKKDALPEDQQHFPDAEMHAIAHYLFQSSDTYLKDLAKLHPSDPKDARKFQDKIDEEDVFLKDLITKPAHMMESGATAVRVSHYQQSDSWYSRCDQAGIVAWAEIPSWQKVLATPEYLESAKQQLRELIRQNFNHPSICFWGVGNETYGPASDPTIVALNPVVHEEDPTRLSTYASNHDDADPKNWHTDVVAFNRYYGWYSGKLSEFAPWLDKTHADYPKARFGMSEFGAGASIFQHEDPPVAPKPNGPYHPEEYQNLVHETYWAALKTRPYVWAKFVWCLHDFASDGRNEGDHPGRNDKGLVTYDRRVKKDAFFFYKANWSKEPVLHITSCRFTERTVPVTEIKVYSNAPEVDLELNGKALGARRDPSADHIFRWQAIALSPGENRVSAKAHFGGNEMTDSCIWTLKAP